MALDGSLTQALFLPAYLPEQAAAEVWQAESYDLYRE
jgi:hypothetical protein